MIAGEGVEMTTQLERTATIESGKVICPFCQSTNVVYAEDVTTRHAILRIEPARLIIVEDDGDIDELPFNERIFCQACEESSALPEESAFEFDE